MSGRYDRHYHIPASAPLGRIDLRAHRKLRFGQRMKPKSWPSSLWFRSALFERGMPSRKRAFGALMQKVQRP